MKRVIPLVVGLLAVWLALAGASTHRVGVSILPMADWVERVGGPDVEALVMVPPGQSPATYEPTMQQIEALGDARLFLRIGVPFEEALLPRLQAVHPDLPVVDLRGELELLPMEPSNPPQHPVDQDRHIHPAGELDPHVWLSPRRTRVMVGTLAEALCRMDPPGALTYRHRARSFQEELASLDRRIARILEPLEGRSLFVFHPAFGYLAADYGLRQQAVETGGKSPGPRHLRELIQRARREGARVIFVQPQFSRRTAETLAEEINGAVVPLDPLARDTLKNLEAMARTIRSALAPETVDEP